MPFQDATVAHPQTPRVAALRGDSQLYVQYEESMNESAQRSASTAAPPNRGRSYLRSASASALERRGKHGCASRWLRDAEGQRCAVHGDTVALVPEPRPTRGPDDDACELQFDVHEPADHGVINRRQTNESAVGSSTRERRILLSDLIVNTEIDLPETRQTPRLGNPCEGAFLEPGDVAPTMINSQ